MTDFRFYQICCGVSLQSLTCHQVFRVALLQRNTFFLASFAKSKIVQFKYNYFFLLFRPEPCVFVLYTSTQHPTFNLYPYAFYLFFYSNSFLNFSNSFCRVSKSARSFCSSPSRVAILSFSAWTTMAAGSSLGVVSSTCTSPASRCA